MHPCHQGVNPLVQIFSAQGDGFLKIQVTWGLGKAASQQCQDWLVLRELGGTVACLGWVLGDAEALVRVSLGWGPAVS